MHRGLCGDGGLFTMRWPPMVALSTERGALSHPVPRAEIARMEPVMEFLRGRNDVHLGPVDSVARAPTVALDGTQCRRIRRNLATAGIMAGVVIYRPLAA